jgi:hypothetical protein
MEENWKIHEDYENYEFSNYGRFRNAETKKILKNTIDDKSNKTEKGGYVISFIKNSKLGIRKRVRIHRMVGLLFVYNPKPSEYNIINHIDGNKTNNHYSNLEWTTVYENNKHAIMNNRTVIVQKLTDENVKLIRQDFLNDVSSIKELSLKYNVHKTTISNVIKYVTWKNIDADLVENYLTMVKTKYEIKGV